MLLILRAAGEAAANVHRRRRVQSSLSGSSVVEKNLDRMTLFVAESTIWIIAGEKLHRWRSTGLLVKAGV